MLGVLGVRPQASLLPLTPDHMDLLETLASQAASALERVRLAGDAEGARVEAEAERLRSTLLSSVSHDFRTPLAAITGAASGISGDLTIIDLQSNKVLKRVRFDGKPWGVEAVRR